MNANESVNTIVLSGWSFRKSGDSKWTPCKDQKKTTSQIHVDLLEHNLIPDPFLDLNEKEVQWVGNTEWEYQTEFTLVKGNRTDLVFEGLDTVVDVYVNDKKILHSENMFHIGRVDISGVAKNGVNRVRIFFADAIERARALEKIHGKMHLFNGESARVQLRKAQYHFGWDWGPVLMTCGPYRPVKIQTYSSVITDVFVNPCVSEKLDADVSVEVDVTTDSKLEVHVELVSPGSEVAPLTGNCTVSRTSTAKIQFHLDSPQLWYPNNYGEQPLYTVITTLVSAGTVIQTISRKMGLRRVKLVQRELIDEPGSSFFFEINNVATYCAGGCWIPAHSFTTQLADTDYKDWIKLMIDGHQNMVRIWGGGIYEEDVFYEECDKQGLMVWQDFMFACGQYPGYPEFLDSVKEEAVTQMRRLRNFCSIVLYAGNNEDYQVAEQYNLEYDPNDNTSDFLATNFPARHIYERLLPELVSATVPHVPYHPGSPWGGANSSDPTVGDIHQWNVWHGNQEKYQDWYKLGGRFISEFGMEALPSRKTIDAFITNESEKFAQSQTMDLHNKATGFERRLALYVMENVQVRGMDLDNWIYSTQLMQSECLAYAYRCWRRQWKGPSREYIGGALVWQVNDCWPVTSWAIIDFYRRPKLSYYAVKRESSPLWLGMYRNERYKSKEEERLGTEVPMFDYFKRDHFEDIWGVNNTTKEKKAVLHVQIFEVESGKLVDTLEPKPVTLQPNQSTEFIKDLPVNSDTHHVVYCRLVDEEGVVIARAGDWPQPLKYLKFPNRNVKATVEDGRIILSSDKPVKGVEVIVKEKDLFLEDNGVDLFPGDDQIINVRGLLNSDEIEIRHYLS
jgi:beta-mannosidase